MKNIILILISIQLASCFNTSKKEADLTGSWRLHDVGSDSQKSNFDAEAESMQVVGEGAMFSFFNDGSYTYITGKGNYINGKWKLEKGENYLAFISPGGGEEKLDFSVSSKPGQPAELILKNENSGTQQKYSRDGDPLSQ